MNGNKLKAIACLSMLIDHIGYMLFPEITVLRYIGRLAMPMFAFFIAEGCRHTKNIWRYFGSIALLGVLCQTVQIISQYQGGINSIHFNVLFTFALAIPLCSMYLKIEGGKGVYAPLFIGYLAALWCLQLFLEHSRALVGIGISLDYSIAGVLLAFMPVLCKEKWRRLSVFAMAVLIFCILMRVAMPYIWYSALSIPLIALYNGKRGSKKLKYMFYIFYPAHIAAIYIIGLLI